MPRTRPSLVAATISPARISDAISSGVVRVAPGCHIPSSATA
jgi:hypothetical protein